LVSDDKDYGPSAKGARVEGSGDTRYRTIVVDPPWEYRDPFGGFNTGAEKCSRRHLPYGAMTLGDIKALPVATLANPEGANLFMWTTNRYMPAAFDVLAAWGASYRQTLIWHKTGANPNTGAVAPTACEFLLYARIHGGARLTGKWDSPLITTKRLVASHSRKPDGFLDRIEQVSSGPYLEMFARRARFGWSYWGNESLGTAEMPAA
jgi:N6-adenosine-specific RNA methylase IME4